MEKVSRDIPPLFEVGHQVMVDGEPAMIRGSVPESNIYYLSLINQPEAVAGLIRNRFEVEVESLPSDLPETVKNRIINALEPAQVIENNERGQKADWREAETNLNAAMREKEVLEQQIAKEREYTLGTIEGHMAHWIKEKKVSLFELMQEEKAEEIWHYIKDIPSAPLTEIRNKIPFEVSFTELRWVKAWYLQEDAT